LLAKAAAEPVDRRRRSPALAGLAVVAAAAMVVVWAVKQRRDGAAPHSHVVIRAGVGARYELSAPPWETVRLWEGRIDLDVEPLGPGDRVRVQVGDGEVEVRGTRFEVTAHGDHLLVVDVAHGRVEVRPAGSPMAVLGAGQEWTARAHTQASGVPGPEPPEPSLAPPALATLPMRSPTSRATPLPPLRPRPARARLAGGAERALRPTRQEQLYDDAWDALRARRFDQAAAGFGRVLAESPQGSLADEAAFWRATSLARGGHTEKALPAFEEFLGKYRSSPRRGEAATILGWLLIDAHRPDEAAPLLRGAVDDPDAKIRKSARDGLDVISRP
jgi:TolA-binding protein